MQFSLDLFKTVFNNNQPGVQSKSTSENIFFSPMSIYSALLLAYFGANNRTEDQLAHVLGFQEMDKVNVTGVFLLCFPNGRSGFVSFSYLLHAFFIGEPNLVKPEKFSWESSLFESLGITFPWCLLYWLDRIQWWGAS